MILEFETNQNKKLPNVMCRAFTATPWSTFLSTTRSAQRHGPSSSPSVRWGSSLPLMRYPSHENRESFQTSKLSKHQVWKLLVKVFKLKVTKIIAISSHRVFVKESKTKSWCHCLGKSPRHQSKAESETTRRDISTIFAQVVWTSSLTVPTMIKYRKV